VSLYSDKVNAFKSEEIKLLLELASDLCYGIAALRVREDRSRVLWALQESEKKFRGITETVASGIFLYQDSRFIYVNPATEAITGYSRQELLQMTPWGFVHPDYISIVQEYGLSRQRGESAPTRYECKILTRSGEERWVDVSAGTMLLNGMHTGVVSLIDITKRKKIEDELRDSQRRMADLINFLPDATFAIDLQGRVIVWNHAVEELTGVKAEEILGKPNYEYAQAFYGQRRPMLIDFVKDSEQSIPEQLFQLTTREDKVLLGEGYTPAIQPGGAYLWGKATALYDSYGNVVGYIESVRNITDRKRAEDELRHSEERYRKLYESMIDGFVMFDMDGRIREYNQAFKEMLGYTDDELYQLTRADITPEKWHDFETNIIEPEILTRGYSDLYEKEYRRKDGTVFPIELRVNLLRDNNGEPTRMWGIIRDITERKRIEKDKRQFYRETIRSVTDGKLDITPIEETRYYIKHNEISLEFRTAAELSNARQQIESYCISNHFPEDSLSVFTTAVGEAMTNALKHAGGGVVLAGKESGELWAGVSDTGPGIATLTLPGATLRRGYSTKVSMGMGYSIMLDISDRILLSTGPEGTTVILFKMLERPRPQISLDDLPDIWETIPNTSTC
jgi:PAS domain S-box-containing protein